MPFSEAEKKHVSSFGLEELPIQGHIVELIDIIRPNYCVLIAGGAVRDHLRGDTAKDIDLCTNATPDELMTLLRSRNVQVKSVGQAFGVVIAILKNERDEHDEVEIATFRTDGQYSDGRRPDSVAFVRNPKEDAIRRDLSINGLFYDPFDDMVIDYVDGIKDMEDGVLRFIGNPAERISEDKLRMLRYVRFLLKTGFNPDELSEQAIRDHADQIKTVSAERIKDELDKIFKIGPISKALQLLKDLNLLGHILPEVDQMSDCEQGPPYHMEGDVFTHTCMVVDNLPEDASNELRWAAILHDIGKPQTREESDTGKVSFIYHEKSGSEMADEICRRLKFSNKEREKIIWLIKNHQKIFKLATMRQSTAKKFVLNAQLNQVNPYFEDLLELCRADEKSAILFGPLILERSFDSIFERFEEIKESLSQQQESGIDIPKLITGYDVMEALGMRHGGPIVGQLLTKIRDELLEMDEPTRGDALCLLYRFGFQED